MKITEIIEAQPGNTPSESQQHDGLRQQYEESVFSTLDALCRSQQQTYAQFMAGFTQLTPENVRSSAVPTDEGPPEEFLRFQASQRTRNNTQTTQTHNTQKAQTHNAQTSHRVNTQMVDMGSNTIHSNSMTSAPQPITDQDSNAIEEQVLSEGDRIQTYLHRLGHVTPRVQVGNYTDEGEDSDHTEEIYTPSFSHGQNIVSDSSEQNKSSTDETLPSDQNEPIPSSDRTPQSDPLRAPRTTTDNQSTVQSRDVNPQQIIAKITGIETDQSDGILDLISADDSDIESDCSDLEYNPSLDMLNFGEIGESSDSELMSSDKGVNTNERTLEFTVVKEARQQDGGGNEANMTGQDPGNLDNHVEGNTVMAFELDTAFDYDNVTLTPKYSREDMDILLTAARVGNPGESTGSIDE